MDVSQVVTELDPVLVYRAVVDILSLSNVEAGRC